MGEASKNLSKEEGLKRIKQVEQKKGEIMTEILVAVQTGMAPESAINLWRSLSNIQALDLLHEETGGIEEGDILIAYNQHQLGETQEYHAIMGEEQRLTM